MELKDGYKNTDFGKIPFDWEYLPLNGLIDLLTGFPFPSMGYSKSGTRLLRGSNIKRGVTDWGDEITQYWENITPEIKKYILNEGDVVISMDGSLVGRSFAQLTNSDLPALLLQRVARIRSEKINTSYLKEIICSKYFTEHCDKVKTVTAIPHISPKDIRNYRIPIPPTKNEQQAIAEVLSDTDNLIQALEEQIAKKRLIKQGAMQQLLTPKEGWERTTIGDCAFIVGGSTPSSFNSSYWNGHINWFTPTEIGLSKYVYSSARKISNEGLKNCSARILPIGSILLTSRAGIGGLSINKVEACTNQGFQSLVAKDDFINEFLYYLMSTYSLQKKLMQNASGSTFLEISPSKLKSIEIFVPPKENQKQISQILSDIDIELENIEQKIIKYKQLKHGLMQNLLTGRIRLK